MVTEIKFSQANMEAALKMAELSFDLGAFCGLSYNDEKHEYSEK